MSTDWQRLVRPSLRGLAPYDPGSPVTAADSPGNEDGVAKLNWNESLFAPVPGVLEAAEAELANAWMYPDQSYWDLRVAAAAWVGWEPEGIIPGHGIQALISTVASVFLSPGDSVIVGDPTYGLYAQVCAALGARVKRVPCVELRLDLAEMARAARRHQARVVWVCDPNNPTGAVVDRDEWKEFLAGLPPGCVVVVDEAYAEYVDPERRIDRTNDIAAGRPVVVLRTLSKIFGLAGLRLGYAVVAQPLAACFDAVLEPFNVNRIALVAGRRALEQTDEIDARRRQTAAARGRLTEGLAAAGLRPFPSHGNFVLVDTNTDASVLAGMLAARRILVRPGASFGLARQLRITVAPEPLMDRVVRELARACAELRAASAA
ncbi:MAG: histidinol-phosphate aminotransferase family protein [Actinomycetota bacterium]|nr:histidinol-phosphate aminotransferase family protein [Actinomycetota bacterium]